MAVTVRARTEWPAAQRLVAVAILAGIQQTGVARLSVIARTLRVSYGTAQRALFRLEVEGIISRGGVGRDWAVADLIRAQELTLEALGG